MMTKFWEGTDNALITLTRRGRLLLRLCPSPRATSVWKGREEAAHTYRGSANVQSGYLVWKYVIKTRKQHNNDKAQAPAVNEPYTNIMKKLLRWRRRSHTLPYRKSVKEHSDYLSNPTQRYVDYSTCTSTTAKY